MNTETITHSAREAGVSVAEYLHAHYKANRAKFYKPSKRIVVEAPQEAVEVPQCRALEKAIERSGGLSTGRDLGNTEKIMPSRLGLLARDICEKHGITLSMLRSDRRFQKLSDARQEFSYIAYVEMGLTFQQIGKYLHKDHTSIVHAVQKMKKLYRAGKEK